MRTGQASGAPIRVLLVEDNPGDVRLTREALRDSNMRHELSVTENGVEAVAFLRRQGKYAAAPRPHLILLDLNLPLKDGREVLREIKQDDDLRRIPVVVLTTSQAEADIVRSYELHANAYVIKPIDAAKFAEAIKQIDEFFLILMRRPR